MIREEYGTHIKNEGYAVTLLTKKPPVFTKFASIDMILKISNKYKKALWNEEFFSPEITAHYYRLFLLISNGEECS